MTELSPALNRLAALALLALLVLALLAYGAAPLWRYYGEQAREVERLQQRLARYRMLVASEELITREHQRIQSPGGEEMLFLPGGKPAVVSANLRQYIGDLVGGSGAQLVSSQEYRAAPVGSSAAVGLRITITATERALVQVLYALESARPVLFIDSMSVQRKGARNPADRLSITLDVAGFLPAETP